MGSTYLKGGRLGSGRCGSSRKGKKEKSKQPQRGLGVAQLEQMRLQSQMEEYVSSLNSPFCSELNMVSQILPPCFDCPRSFLPPKSPSWLSQPEDSRVEMAFSSPPSSPSGIVSGPSFAALHPNMMVSQACTHGFVHGRRRLRLLMLFAASLAHRRWIIMETPEEQVSVVANAGWVLQQGIVQFGHQIGWKRF